MTGKAEAIAQAQNTTKTADSRNGTSIQRPSPHKAEANPEQSTLTLGRLYERALRFDQVYRAAHAQAKADAEAEKQGLAALLPQIGAGAQVKKEDSTRTAFGQSIDTESTPDALTVTLRQPLFRAENWQTYKQGELLSELGKIKLSAARQDLILRLATAWFEVLRARDNLDTVLSQKEAIGQQLEFAKRNFEIGTATITDQQEAQARFDLILAQESATRNQLEVNKLQLIKIAGKLDNEPWPKLINDAQIPRPVPFQVEEWSEKAERQNLLSAQAELGLQIARREASKSKMAHLPTLDLEAEYLKAEQQVFDNTTGQPFNAQLDNRSVGLTLAVPIFSGGFTQSKVREKAALLSKAEADFDLARSEASLAAKAAFLNIRSGLEQINALQTAVKSSELALQANQTGYRVGVRINIDVLNAQQQLSSARRDLFSAKYNTLLGLLQLQAASGQLDADYLRRMDGLFIRYDSKTKATPG